MPAILEVTGLTKSFGAISIVSDVAFAVEDGEVLGVIGPNGAGKTTLFGLLAGTVPIDGGRITFGSRDVTDLPTFERARLGIARTYQVPRPFAHMRVADNLRVAALFGGGLEEAECPDWIEQILDFTGLAKRRDTLAGRLSLLDRKRHELARALATRPSLLLVDEVAAGLTDSEVDEFILLVRKIKAAGITIVWIEHVMKTMLVATDRLMALAGGKIIAMGAPQEVIRSHEVRRVYLGA